MSEESYSLTPAGWKSASMILGEFCNGFTIEEIAKNSDHSVEEIIVLMMTLIESYARAYLTPDEIIDMAFEQIVKGADT